MPSNISGSPAWRQPSFWKLVWNLPKLVRLLGRLFRDARVPAFGKLVFVASIAYLISPIDLIPDFLFPILGQLDDLGMLLAGLRYLLNRTPPNILEEHLAEIG
ncbi:MAG: hypothetical protein ALAOOOJD_04056 [bacterium]|nr:hypothetical protein [bacterium]